MTWEIAIQAPLDPPYRPALRALVGQPAPRAVALAEPAVRTGRRAGVDASGHGLRAPCCVVEAQRELAGFGDEPEGFAVGRIEFPSAPSERFKLAKNRVGNGTFAGRAIRAQCAAFRVR